MQKKQCHLGGFFYHKLQQGRTFISNNKVPIVGTLTFGAGFLLTLLSTDDEDLKLIAKQQALIQSKIQDNAIQRELLAGEMDVLSGHIARIQQDTKELIDEIEGNESTASSSSSSSTTDPDKLEDKIVEIEHAQMTLFEYQAVLTALQQREEEKKKSQTTSLRLN